MFVYNFGDFSISFLMCNDMQVMTFAWMRMPFRFEVTDLDTVWHLPLTEFLLQFGSEDCLEPLLASALSNGRSFKITSEEDIDWSHVRRFGMTDLCMLYIAYRQIPPGNNRINIQVSCDYYLPKISD